jgi:hypothetical protein
MTAILRQGAMARAARCNTWWTSERAGILAVLLLATAPGQPSVEHRWGLHAFRRRYHSLLFGLWPLFTDYQV